MTKSRTAFRTPWNPHSRECPGCGMELHVSEWTKGEQRAIDRAAAGQCENCGRPMQECDAVPCVEEG